MSRKRRPDPYPSGAQAWFAPKPKPKKSYASPSYGAGTYGSQPASPPAGTYGSPPAAPPPAPLAHDSIYNLAADTATRRKANADSEFTYGLGVTGSRYGFRANVNPDTGAFSVAEMDPTSPDYNPFNQMAQLRKHFENSKRGVKNRYAAQGQLYSGALQNAQDDTVEEYQKGYGQLSSSFADMIRGLVSNRNNAYSGASDYLAAAGADELTRRAAQPAVASQAAPATPYGVQPIGTASPTPDVPYTPAMTAALKRWDATAPDYTSKPYTSPSGVRGTLHIYPGGRRVFVKK